MSIVVLASGGLDSTLVACLAKQQRIKQYPLFIDYGQRAARREWGACQRCFKKLALPQPKKVNLRGFGNLIRTGLTDTKKALVKDAFTPGRNFLFLLVGAGYAVQVGASGVAIGLLDEERALFPDQRFDFLIQAERAIQIAVGKKIRIIAPLMSFTKRDVVRLAGQKGVTGTYSCHLGTAKPCGKCISCKEVR